MNEEMIQQPLSNIVKAIDGDALFIGCGLGLKYCSEDVPCPIHEQFKMVRSEIKKMLEQSLLSDFSDLLNNKMTCLKK